LSIPCTLETEFGGRKLSFETGRLAGQADAAVVVRYGDTVVLVTACVAPNAREGTDFLPLTIDYEERLYAAGKIPGGFIRREGRPSEQATLTARLTDRPIRPLLPKEWRRDIQIVVTVLAVDRENDPDILSVIGGSAALMNSRVPFSGPVSAARVGYTNNEFVLNPPMPQLEQSSLDLVVVSTSEAVAMLEAGANAVSEDIVRQAIEFGHRANQQVIALQNEFQKACGKPKDETPVTQLPAGLMASVTQIIAGRLSGALNYTEKAPRDAALDLLRDELVAGLK